MYEAPRRKGVSSEEVNRLVLPKLRWLVPLWDAHIFWFPSPESTWSTEGFVSVRQQVDSRIPDLVQAVNRGLS